MKKWDDDFRMKSYVNKIQNAKSTVPSNQKKSMKKQPNRDSEYSSHVSYRSDFTDIKESLLFKQLFEYNLQQYAHKLLLRGYLGGLQTLAQQPIDLQNQILQEIRLLPGHKQKFLDLFKYLNDHYNPHNYNVQNSQTPTYNQQNRNTLPQQFNSHSKIEQTREPYIEILKPVNRRASLKHFSPLQEIGVIKPRVLPKLERRSINGNNDKSPKFSDSLTQQLIPNQGATHGSSLSITKEIPKSLSKTNNIPIVKIKQTIKKKSMIKQNAEKDNKLLKKLLQINSKNSIGAEIQLQQDQIQLMYQSFDNGKLASTLINIDIEEISYCVSITLQKMISIVDLEQQRYLENEIQEIQQQIFKESDQYEEFESRTNKERYSEDCRDEENNDQTVNISKVDQTNCQDYLGEAIIEPEITDQYYGSEDVATEQIQNADQSEQSKLQTEQEQGDYFQVQEQDNNEQVSKSYFSVDTSYNLEDYLLFNKVFIDKTMTNYIPNVDIIQNYCKNIMTTTKMEREVAIISMIYINRLLNYNQGLELNCFNWQKILFTSLIMASKIWDDESFENNNFAKVLPQFSTLQINEMERVFLKLIEYHLYVNSGEYAKQYFILRTYADKKQRSYALKQLDISTVLRLQRGGQQQISKQQYLNTQNKSF
ncbi:unnamed protein product (macronuclear) [Paramecium tetraurelia]|uniref:Cyclin N-terminal domain-containing protein n=1 Tax=Paramecium tetraurelia TaxID=5888 RepID=A0CUD8_PARTE|nr:uncharacterized protein GSPATT00010605001 [Paramecium tetraurelia]CAK74405.1 unnamed protein product [Paramecium tetraurelia]|eukprot:XP_001441802.1 hypothetical protein (macronuclear) [Paramecium tetraurelia strain d4-2]